MSILKAQLSNLTRVVSLFRELEGMDVREIIKLDVISKHVANCRKLRIHDEDILAAVVLGKERFKQRSMNEQKKAS